MNSLIRVNDIDRLPLQPLRAVHGRERDAGPLPRGFPQPRHVLLPELFPRVKIRHFGGVLSELVPDRREFLLVLVAVFRVLRKILQVISGVFQRLHRPLRAGSLQQPQEIVEGCDRLARIRHLPVWPVFGVDRLVHRPLIESAGRDIPAQISVRVIQNLYQIPLRARAGRQSVIGQNIPVNPMLISSADDVAAGKGQILIHAGIRHRLRLTVVAIQHCDLLRAPPVRDLGADPLHEESDFRPPVLRGNDSHPAGAASRPHELLLKSLPVIRDQCAGLPDDLAAGPVIDAHPDHRRVRIVLPEFQHDLRPRAPESVDGLIIVPHDRQIPVRTRDRVENIPLHGIGVLILVHLDVMISVPQK